MIKVLIVEDSPVVQELLIHILTSDPEIEVTGTAGNGEEALEFLRYNRPDIITMDIVMPGMNGFEVTRRIMETDPLPIVILSASWNPSEVEKSFHAIEAGAVTALEKPTGLRYPNYNETARELIQTVKLMSEVKVVRRLPDLRYKSRLRQTGAGFDLEPLAAVPAHSRDIGFKQLASDINVVAIGASTGGPQALQVILSGLSKDFAPPILIVQHIAAGFVEGFVNWLNQSSAIPVQLASHGEPILSGHAYVAPDGFHMGVLRGNHILLSKAEPENFIRPSASYLFRSIAKVFGKHSLCILLTGMGKDGAKELRLLKKMGAITIAQDKESSVVHGMPGEAIKLNAAMYVLSPGEIVAKLRLLNYNV